jgi:hypothetical protein
MSICKFFLSKQLLPGVEFHRKSRGMRQLRYLRVAENAPPPAIVPLIMLPSTRPVYF